MSQNRNLFGWSIAATAVASALTVISFPIASPIGGAAGTLTATLTGHHNYSTGAMFAGMIGLPVIIGFGVTAACLAGHRLGLIRSR